MACGKRYPPGPYDTASVEEGDTGGRQVDPDEREGFSVNDLVWLLCRPASAFSAGGYGLLPSEVAALTIPQIINLLRPDDKRKPGKPAKYGLRAKAAVERELSQMRSAAEAIRLSEQLTAQRQNGTLT